MKGYVESLGINEANCNNTLTKLYAIRDEISSLIDKYLWQGKDTSSLEALYDERCDVIEEICNWRRGKNCALEGDDWAEPSVV